MLKQTHYRPLFAMLSAAAVLSVAGLDGLVQTVLAVLTCEYAVCVAKTLRDTDGDESSVLFALLQGGGLYLLLAMAALLDSLLPGVAFRATACLVYIANGTAGYIIPQKFQPIHPIHRASRIS
jgi:hypothetical protein